MGPRDDLVLPGFEPRNLQPVLIILFCKGACTVWRLVYDYPAQVTLYSVGHCFSAAGPRPGTGPLHQL